MLKLEEQSLSGKIKKYFAKRSFSVGETIQSYMMLLPQLIGFLVFAIYPILWVLRWAWFDYDGFSEAQYIAFNNFIRLFTRDPDYWRSLANTFILSFGKLAIELPLALILAVFLNGKLKGKHFYRTMFYMPNVISVAIIGLLFYFLFATFEGIVNNLLLDIGLISEPVNWFGQKWTAMAVIALASIWQNFGVNMLFFLAGLQNISPELYESADIDGATKFQQFFRITLPMLAPVMQVVFMLAIIGSIKMTDLVLVLTNGMPAGETDVVMTYVFKHFFSYGASSSIPQIGYASAMGFVTAIIIGIVTGIYLLTTRKMSKTY